MLQKSALRLSHPNSNRQEPPASSRIASAIRALALGTTLWAGVLSGFAQTVPEPLTGLTAAEKEQGFSNRSFLAKLRADVDPRELVASESREGVRTRRSLNRGETRVLEVASGGSVTETISRLRATGLYEFVEHDYVVKIHATPNDPRFNSGDQWSLKNIGLSGGTVGADIKAESAWDIRTSASDIVVAIIDSGMRRTHEDLAANLWINPGESGGAASNGLDDDNNGYVDDANGINATVARGLVGTGVPEDEANHGTGVASVIGAVGNNGLGMAGVAWNVKLMPLRFIASDGYGLISDEIECLDYAIAKRAHIINASFGGAAFSQSLFDAFKRVRDAGIIVVCASNNEAENHDARPQYPADYLLDNIVAVANTTRADTLAPSSGYSAGLVDLGAPGSSIYVASSAGNNQYATTTGTSFATPHVSGALALIKAQFPNESYRETINRLLRSVDPKPSLLGKTHTGGRLNVANALRTTSARPFNDEFAQRAQYVGEVGTVRTAAQLATREAGEPVHAGAAGNGSLWWSWTAPRSGAFTLSTTDSAVDTLLAVYTGSSISALTSVASNDDESASLKTSKVSFNAVAGTTYQIAVDCKGAASGLVVLRFDLRASNNDFASAQLVSGRSWNVKSDNRSASREADEPRIRNNAGGRSVWYRWVAPATRRYHIATFSTDFNSMLGIYTGTAVNALTEIAAATSGGDSNYTIADAAVTFTATAGTTYYISVESEVSSTGTSGSGAFTLSCVDSEWEYFVRGSPGTPAVAADGTIYVVDLEGYLYALNPDGSRKWRYTLNGYGTYSAPTIGPDGTVHVSDDLGNIYGIDPAGTRKWAVNATGTYFEASPAIGPNGLVYCRGENGRLYALAPVNASAVLLWSVQLGDTATATYTSPVIAPDGTIYCASSDSKLYAVSPEGAIKWSFSTDFIYSSPAIGSDGTIYFGTIAPTRRFYALKPDGTVKWELVVGDTVSSSPVIGPDGTIYFGSYDKKVYAVSPAGEIRWTYETSDAIRTTTPIVAADGAIYVGSIDGKIYCLEADGKLRRTYSTAGEIRSAPILHNGRLLMPSEDYRIYSIEVGQVPASSAWPMHRQNRSRNGRYVASALGIAVQPKAQSAEVNDNITFSVGAAGSPPLAYQWFFNGQAITGATGATLRLDSVTHANGGQYSVRVTDSTGNLTSSAVALTITTPLVPPTVVAAPANQTAFAGGGFTLTVGANGTVPMTYQWLRDGTPIAGATSSTYQLSDARPAHSGSYSVRLTNFAGTVTSPAATVTINPISRIANLSIRSQVGGSAGTLTVGLTVGGAATTGAKPLLLRAIGPTLAAFGVTGTLADPQLAMLSGQNIVTQNDDWAGNAEVSATSTAVGAFALTNPASKDAALAQSSQSGGYTVRINGAAGSSGVALAEVYDASPSDNFVLSTPRLINVSALTQVGTGGDILITGFSIAGTTPKTVMIRGIGPTLASFGVTGALADPKLDLFQAGATTAMSTNDNWGTATNATQVATAAAGVGAFALTADSKDAVLLVTLPPGSYTAQVSGTNGGTGLALVEVYEIP